jgi:hypothetical protein
MESSLQVIEIQANYENFFKRFSCDTRQIVIYWSIIDQIYLQNLNFTSAYLIKSENTSIWQQQICSPNFEQQSYYTLLQSRSLGVQN